MISVYGAGGFIGSRVCELYSGEVKKIKREQRSPESSEILFLISTVDNYNVFSDPHLDINTNLNLLIEVLEECRKLEDKDMVFNFISSWFVYGKTDTLPAKEGDYCDPRGFYSITKRAAEQLLISYCKTHKINYRILRLANVYGESDTKVSKKRNALQHLIGELASDRDINLYDGGEHIRDFIYIDDACRAIKICLDKAGLNETTNIGSGVPRKFKDMMLYSKQKLNSKSSMNSIEPPRFHDIIQVKNMYLDTKKLESLGFEIEYGMEQGLDKVLESYLK